MSYEPTNWKDGDLVTSAKLNKLEQGIADVGVLIVNEDDEGVLDKTWQEIHDAARSKVVCLFYEHEEEQHICYLVETFILNEEYQIGFGTVGDIFYYSTDSKNGYPISVPSGQMPSPGDLNPGGGNIENAV